jgi:tetratricopeptide (TPR) repeat protein
VTCLHNHIITLANIYLDRGEYNKAVQEFYAALKINPDFIYSLLKLHDLYVETHQVYKASLMKELINNVKNGIPNDFKDIHTIITQ